MLSYKQIVRKMSDKNSEKSLDSNYVKPLKGFKKYISNKLMKFIESYERILQKRFPSTFRVVQTFTIGTKDFYKDILEYFRISRELSYGKQVRDLSYNELMVYFKTPKDLRKVGPVLLLSALPLAQYLIFPLALLLPKYMLSSHYWTIQQRIQFQVSDQTNKLYYYRPVFRQLQSKLSFVSIEDNLQEKCRKIFARLGSGTHPSVEQLLQVKQSFIDSPYGLQYLTSRHLTNLCRMHGLNAFIGKRARLWNHIGFVREMDLALIRDGFHSLTIDQIRKACFIRGLNPMSLSKEDMILWLKMWTNIAQNVDSRSFSLLLHCPIFIAYNNPSNWRLIH